jgi:hypothetical protein
VTGVITSKRPTTKQKATRRRVADFWIGKRAKATELCDKARVEWDYLRAIIRDAPDSTQPELWKWLAERFRRDQHELLAVIKAVTEAEGDGR